MTQNQDKGKQMQVKTQVFAALAASTISVSIGSIIAIPACVIPAILKEQVLVNDFQTASLIATVLLIVATPTSILGGLLSDKFGRRKMALISTIPLFVGHAVVSTAQSFNMVLVGRCLAAFGGWIGYPCANVIISEVTHPDMRSTLGVIPSVSLSLGVFLSYLFGYIFDLWRWMSWSLIIQPVVTAVMITFIRESPYWLVQHDREEEARQSLQWYRGQDYNISQEIKEIIARKEEQANEEKVSLMSTVFSLKFFRLQLCTGILFLFEQFSGISSLISFMQTIFQESGLSFDPRLAPVIVSALRILSGLGSSYALQRGSRKILFALGTAGQSVPAAIMACLLLYRVSAPSSSWWLGVLPFPMVLIMFISNSFGVNPIMHLTTAEVYPTSIRSLGNGSVVCMAGGGNALQAALIPLLMSVVGLHGCFFLFCVVSLLMGILGFCFIPDNRGLSLATIEKGINQRSDKHIEC